MPWGESAGAQDEPSRVRELVVEAVEAAAALIAGDEVVARWDAPRALDGMTVGALTAHLVRAAGATLAYLDRTDTTTRPDGAVLTPVTYFQAAIDAPIHERIKQVSASEAAAGPAELAVRSRRSRRRCVSASPRKGRTGSWPPWAAACCSLDDFCRTRLIEVLLHLDDLAASLGVPCPETSVEGRTIVIELLLGIARAQHGDWEVLRAGPR